MTNEEAIKLLSQIKDALLASNSWLPSTDNPIKESFGMAINALTAQSDIPIVDTPTVVPTCEDTISRQDAIRVASGYCHPANIAKELAKLPSAQPDKDMIHLQKEQAYMQGWEEGRKALREEIWENERDRLD